MIKKSSKGYAVYTKDGSQRLSKWYSTKEAAQKRLREIEYFKQNRIDRVIPTKREKDPTGQAGNRRKAKAEIARRIKQAREPVLQLLDSIPVAQVTINRVTYQYLLSADRLIEIDNEIGDIIRRLLELPDTGKPQRWFFDEFIEQAYREGTAQSAGRIESMATSANLPQASQLQIEQILLSEPYRRRFELVSARAFENMKGFAGDAARDLGRILGEGVALGESPRTIAASIRQKFDEIEGYRALRIARTEVGTAYKKARKDQTVDARDRLGLQVKVMHLSALVPNTRPGHAARHGKIYTAEEEEQWQLSGTNPINCLCGTVEILFLDGEPLQKDIIEKQRKRGLSYFMQHPEKAAKAGIKQQG